MNKQLKSFQQIDQLQQQPSHYQIQVNQRHYGACVILARDSSGQPKYTLGPHYYVFIIALIALTSLLIALIYTMKQRLTLFWFIIMIICGILFFYSYLSIGISVPGFASKAQQPTQQMKLNPKYCKPCKTLKINGVYHCYDCDVCIQAYDHHCPWIGKCVGKKNLGSFYFFLFMTFGTLIMCFIATIASNPSGKNLRTDSKNPNNKFTIKT